MAQDKLQTFLNKHGDNPKQSVKFFVIGLCLFMLAVALIYLGVIWHYSIQVIGLVVLAIALFYAAKGYLGIITNRIAFFRHQAHKNKQRFKNIK